MSSSRIYKCLEHVACRVTTRGKQVLKYSGIGFVTGTTGGAVLGGLSIGFHDAVLFDKGKSDYRASHCSTDKAGTQSCTSAQESAAIGAGLDYAKEEIAKVWSLIFIISTLGGAALGTLSGAVVGWKKEIDSAEPEPEREPDLEAQPSISYRPLN